MQKWVRPTNMSQIVQPLFSSASHNSSSDVSIVKKGKKENLPTRPNAYRQRFARPNGARGESSAGGAERKEQKESIALRELKQ